MPTTSFSSKRSRGLSAMLFLACLSMAVGIMYLGREILIPIALSILLTFILAPIVTTLRRWGAGQLLSVIITVVLTVGVIGTVGTVIAFEFKGLANELPAYRKNIRQKISDIRNASKSESLAKVKTIAKEISDELQQEGLPITKNQETKSDGTNAPVVVQEKTTITEKNPAIDSLMELFGSVGLVVVLVVFMLLRREDLRDRLLHLGGRERLVTTTNAIEEIGDKVSRYLVRQCFLNTIYGVGITLGLFLIGVPYAMLWGFLAAIARFIPYAGPVIGAVAPILMSLAVFDSWASPLIIIGLILGWELVNNMILEPVIYGQGIGVSEVALLIMMAFWTWLWGPVGLILAAPLTVCMVVICKGVPELNFISLLLGSKAALTPQHALYQRLVAQNQDEARILINDFLKTHSRTELFETLLLPVLRTCRDDRMEHRLSGRAQRQMLQVLRQVLETIRPRTTADGQPSSTAVPHSLIVGCPDSDGVDEMALHLLAEMLAVEHVFMPVISGTLDDGAKAAEILALKPDVLCLGMLSESNPFSKSESYQQLRHQLPHLTIVAGLWGATLEPEELPQPKPGDLVGCSLSETVKHLASFYPEPEAMPVDKPSP